jgi:ElaA protein
LLRRTRPSGGLAKIVTEWQRFEALSAVELYELLCFRQAIFVVEQRSAYPDLDGLDRQALHLLARAEGTLAGCLRLLPSPLRIGRVAVAAALRGQGLGRRLMREALLYCSETYPARAVAISAQAYLVPYYRSFGFAATGEPYDDFGVTHIDMELRPGGIPPTR